MRTPTPPDLILLAHGPRGDLPIGIARRQQSARGVVLDAEDASGMRATQTVKNDAECTPQVRPKTQARFSLGAVGVSPPNWMPQPSGVHMAGRARLGGSAAPRQGSTSAPGDLQANRGPRRRRVIEFLHRHADV